MSEKVTHGGLHESVQNVFFIYKGYRFTPPFHCMYCGVEVCAHQWAFSRSCGGCDVGNSHTAKLHLFQWTAGPHELVDEKDSHLLPADQFVPLEEVIKKSPINPPKRWPPFGHQFGVEEHPAD
jgi:hypothetical protein